SPSGHPFFQKPLSSFPRPCPSSARPGLDDPGSSSCHTADPRSTTQPTQPACCRTSITPPPVVATPTSTSQHAATATASPAPTADVAAHALATASARCPLPASTAFIHAVRAVHQRPRLLGPSRQQSTARLPCNKIY
ncbi:hypothetical protein ACLOJK_007020, partial [Asimina triloba]